MTNRTCSIPGCDKAYRAKGLCSTHYNQQHQPDRHRKVRVPCAWCGTPVTKERTTKRKPTCSAACRTRIQHPPKCELPPDHWARWYGKTSDWPRFPIRPCDQCGNEYAPKSEESTVCSRECTWRRARAARRHMSMEEWANLLRDCATCGTTYSSPWPNQTTCTQCRRPTWGGKWITPARRARLYARDRYMCHICGKKTNPKAGPSDPSFPSLDHIVPRSKGGTNADYNLSTACRLCNALRADADLPVLQLA